MEILRGITASRGKIEGEVFLSENSSDLSSFRDGSILVARATNPLYATCMARAGGVITDIGGITYHAAISAREFKIPCLVGTGNASKILKTGQKIILDADNGVVFEK